MIQIPKYTNTGEAKTAIELLDIELEKLDLIKKQIEVNRREAVNFLGSK